MDPAIAKRRDGYVPYKLAVTQKGETVEMMNYPHPETNDGGPLCIHARTEVGDATTLKLFHCDELVPYDKIQSILFVGTIEEGFFVVGTFERESDAAAHAASLKCDHGKAWIMPLVVPYEDEHRTPLDGVQDDPHVIIWGTPLTGYIGVGPFDCLEDAEEYSGNLKGESTLFPLVVVPTAQEE